MPSNSPSSRNNGDVPQGTTLDQLVHLHLNQSYPAGKDCKQKKNQRDGKYQMLRHNPLFDGLRWYLGERPLILT